MTAATNTSYTRGGERPRDVTRATLLSLLIHAVLILLIALFSALSFQFSPAVKEEEEEPMELTILPEPPPNIRQEPVYVATTAAQEVEEAPPDAPFESDRDTRAASEIDPTDPTLAMPAVEGEESEFLDFRRQELTLGPQPVPSIPSPATEPRPLAEAAPAPEPVVEEEPVKEEETPAPPKPEELAMLRPQERPSPQPTPRVQEIRPATPVTESPAGFQPQARTTRIQGGISTRGRAAVDAAATPLGKYKKMLSDAIGSRWYYYVNAEIGLLNIGTVVIRFTVEQDGSVRGIQVLSNTSNESFATCSIRSIVEAEIPPIPPDVAAVLNDGRIEVDYTFTILAN
jgi:outer membrane biosynthesis protein TonB